MAKRILILMGSDSDWGVMKQAAQVFEDFEVEYDVRVLSVHRVPEVALKVAREAESNGFRVIVAGAGLAAHLPGAVAAHTVLPVVGVPLEAGALRGVDALYSTVMMPPGVPVGTMAIGGARNAAVFALQILGAGDDHLRAELHSFKEDLARKALEKDRKIREERAR